MHRSNEIDLLGKTIGTTFDISGYVYMMEIASWNLTLKPKCYSLWYTYLMHLNGDYK